MKSFKSFILEMKKNEDDVYVIKHPIHFKHDHKKEKISLDEIFDDLREEVDLQNPNSEFSKKYIHVNDNTNLGGLKKFEPEPPNPKKASLANIGHLNDQVNRIISTQKPFSKRQIKAIGHYTTDKGSREINHNLLAQKHNPKNVTPLPATHQTTIKNLDDAIKNNPVKIPHSVYSGISEDLGKQFMKKKRVHSPAYISASLDKKTARFFANKKLEKTEKIPEQHYLHIHLKPGDPATHISEHSWHTPERETIIGRGVTLKHIKTEKFKGAEGSTVYVHHVRIAK